MQTGLQDNSWDEFLSKHSAAEIPDQEGDDPNGCASHLRARSLFCLGIKRPGKPDKIIEYYDFEAVADNTHAEIVMGARKVWRIVLKGRNLLQLVYHMKERRIDWIRQADRDVQKDGELFIESITLTDITKQVREADEAAGGSDAVQA